MRDDILELNYSFFDACLREKDGLVVVDREAVSRGQLLCLKLITKGDMPGVAFSVIERLVEDVKRMDRIPIEALPIEVAERIRMNTRLARCTRVSEIREVQ